MKVKVGQIHSAWGVEGEGSVMTLCGFEVLVPQSGKLYMPFTPSTCRNCQRHDDDNPSHDAQTKELWDAMSWEEVVERGDKYVDLDEYLKERLEEAASDLELDEYESLIAEEYNAVMEEYDNYKS